MLIEYSDWIWFNWLGPLELGFINCLISLLLQAPQTILFFPILQGMMGGIKQPGYDMSDWNNSLIGCEIGSSNTLVIGDYYSPS